MLIGVSNHPVCVADHRFKAIAAVPVLPCRDNEIHLKLLRDSNSAVSIEACQVKPRNVNCMVAVCAVKELLLLLLPAQRILSYALIGWDAAIICGLNR
jgi:hypothetical protein